jgi:hypothetical protein
VTRLRIPFKILGFGLSLVTSAATEFVSGQSVSGVVKGSRLSDAEIVQTLKSILNRRDALRMLSKAPAEDPAANARSVILLPMAGIREFQVRHG